MRTSELEAQLQDLESKLAKLTGEAIDEIWILIPVSTLPCPPSGLIEAWVAELGLTGVTVTVAPSRHQSRTALARVPNHTAAPQPEGWTCVDVSSGLVADASAWHHPKLTHLFQQYLDARGG